MPRPAALMAALATLTVLASCAAAGKAPVAVSAEFDTGNIEVLGVEELPAGDGPETAGGEGQAPGAAYEITLQHRHDPYSPNDERENYQWFYFRLSNAANTSVTLRIVDVNNATAGGGSNANIPGVTNTKSAWDGYNPVMSYDQHTWRRTPATYDREADGGTLSWTLTPEQDSVWFAYFAPYPTERHTAMVAELGSLPGVSLESLGTSLDGRELDLLTIGEPGPDKLSVWVTARQHPGETMGEWAAEGLLRRLTDPTDAAARRLLNSTVFYVVPNMNPDGAARGHYRTNAIGVNLNREWVAPSMGQSPEVYQVQARMNETGVDFFLDLHGDPRAEWVFTSGMEGVPRYDEWLAGVEEGFKATLVEADPDYLPAPGYPVDKPGEADLRIASYQVAQRFGAPSFTIEQPFKDTTVFPDPATGYSAERAMGSGGDVLEALLAVLPDLQQR